MLGVSLVKSWLACFGTKAEALRELNKKLGRSYQHGHLSRWERGLREPDRKARHEMTTAVLASEHPDWTPRRVAAFAEKLR
jgi:hypothetical protein